MYSVSKLGLSATVIVLVAMAAHASAAQKPPPRGPGSLSGIWTNTSYNPDSVYDPRLAVLRDVHGNLPPMRPWAAELLEKRIKAAEEGHPYANTKSMCLPSGVPQLMFGPRTPMQILETSGQVTMLIEEFNDFRIVLIHAKHAMDLDPNIMGDSVGRWEGDTFVVDTIGLSEQTTLDVSGMPHTDELHVVERFRRAGDDLLEVLVTLDDPGTFTAPRTSRATFKHAPVSKLTEYYCENQRNPSVDGKTITQMPGELRPWHSAEPR